MRSLQLLCTVGGDLASPRTEAKKYFFQRGGGSWSCTSLYIVMLEYLVTRKEGIVYFIYKAIPLLSIDADKKTVREVINRYMLKVSNIHAKYMLYLYI